MIDHPDKNGAVCDPDVSTPASIHIDPDQWKDSLEHSGDAPSKKSGPLNLPAVEEPRTPQKAALTRPSGPNEFSNGDNMSEPLLLYNSRIIHAYIEYLRRHRPEVDVDAIFKKSDITREEIADTAHWFSQEQVDRFHKIVVTESGDENISRQVGRFSASSKGLNAVKQYVLGFINIETAFISMTKIFPLLTRASTVKVRTIGPGRIEIISKPLEGIKEQPHQCENRLGAIEAVPRLFTDVYAQVAHPECLHKGHPQCRYDITWNKPASFTLRLSRNYTLLFSAILLPILFWLAPVSTAAGISLLLLLCNGLLAMGYASQKIHELEKIVESQHRMAEEQIESSKIRYNNALLVQEIGQATASIFNIDAVMAKLADLMRNRLDFERGLIMLADKDAARLTYSAGYGYTEEDHQYIRNAQFRLDHQDAHGIFVRSFLDQSSLVVDDMESHARSFSARSQNLIRQLKVRSIICVPIVFERKSLGVLAVDNIRSKMRMNKSDLNLLQGIASQIAICLNNVRSFQQLQVSEEKYRQTLESIEEGYFELDSNGRMLYVNRALCDLLGYSTDELVHHPFTDHFSPQTVDRLEAVFTHVKLYSKPVRFVQVDACCKDGVCVPVDLSASLMILPNGEGTGFRGIIRDARDRLQFEEERKKLEIELQQAQKMEALGTLAGGIAHNFNNWLSGILGNVQLIGFDSKSHPRIIERISKIEDIIENASRMIRQLLGYARGGNYEIKPLKINDIVRESADTFGTVRKEITVVLGLEPQLHTVKADKSQIEQVLWNLYVNAADAMDSGGLLTIRTRNTSAEDYRDGVPDILPGEYVAVSVSDTGSGIDPQYFGRVFDPFFTTKSNGRGTGLGLASAYGIIKAHRGYIHLQSLRDVGSTFTILLPVMDAPLPWDQHNRPQVKKGNETILLVDDEQTVLESTRDLLSRIGYRVLTASNAEDAVKLFKESTVDLVIIDMIMPRINGRELNAMLKKIDPKVKTLLSSGYSINDTVKSILDLGFQGFIQKPYTLNQISEKIREILQPLP